MIKDWRTDNKLEKAILPINGDLEIRKTTEEDVCSIKPQCQEEA